uniref:B30.2/SPRY domain-containing protein n=1 Tax=Cyprinodon variegatus TaxID=28743 RepID=A0A3Q2FYI3_CYPVA
MNSYEKLCTVFHTFLTFFSSYFVVFLLTVRSETAPKVRARFLKYSREIILDPNTANRLLSLSEGNRKVILTDHQQSYPDHKDRFTTWPQVLSRDSLTGRCYWEVEWKGVAIAAVSYDNINRADKSNEGSFGWNKKSWSLRCEKNSYIFQHNSIQTPVSGPVSSRIGVYLDHRAGILCFYSVSETMTLLHRVQTTFTKPLYAGIRLRSCINGSTADFVKLK